MNNIDDLNIEKELLPLFDYSLNMFAKRNILDILKKPLSSISAISDRQRILKGFAANHDILKDYSYTVLYLNEVHFFLNDDKIEDLSQHKFKYRVMGSKREKARYLGKFNQLILFFHRLERNYFMRLKLAKLPKDYARAIQRILHFLSLFQLDTYERIVREDRLRDKHVIELTQKIHELKKKELISLFWKDLFLFEAYLSISLGILKHGFAFPVVGAKGMELLDCYHPGLSDPVKNDFITHSNVIVLNGPNMSGKSTFLKAVGLCMYLGHLGLGIPASSVISHFVITFQLVSIAGMTFQMGIAIL